MASGRPQPTEYAPYYETYVSLVPSDDILAVLEQQRRDGILLLNCRSEEEGDFRYAPGKWSVKELWGHVCDAERIFAYRALRFSRGDQAALEGFEQDDYIPKAPFARRPMSDLVEEFIAVRRASVSLFRMLDDAAWDLRGVASKNEVSVRGLAYIIAGHELHHRRILEQKYLTANTPTAAHR